MVFKGPNLYEAYSKGSLYFKVFNWIFLKFLEEFLVQPILCKIWSDNSEIEIKCTFWRRNLQLYFLSWIQSYITLFSNFCCKAWVFVTIEKIFIYHEMGKLNSKKRKNYALTKKKVWWDRLLLSQSYNTYKIFFCFLTMLS